MNTDTERLDWLEAHPRHAQVLIDGVTKDCVLYGISTAQLMPLRDALDVLMAKGEENALHPN